MQVKLPAPRRNHPILVTIALLVALRERAAQRNCIKLCALGSIYTRSEHQLREHLIPIFDRMEWPALGI